MWLTYIGLLILALIGPVTLVAMWEKRLAWPYGPPEPERPWPDHDGYGARWVQSAREAGFTMVGWSRDLKGDRYQLSYAFLTSPDRDCLVIVGVGKLFNMVCCGTSIYTATADGRMLMTTDNQSSIEIDVLRLWKTQLRRTRAFPQLLQSHRDMLRETGVISELFPVGSEVQNLKVRREDRFRAAAEQGFIRFDAEGLWWRYTFRGAVKFSVLNFVIGFVRAITFGRVPRLA